MCPEPVARFLRVARLPVVIALPSSKTRCLALVLAFRLPRVVKVLSFSVRLTLGLPDRCPQRVAGPPGGPWSSPPPPTSPDLPSVRFRPVSTGHALRSHPLVFVP